MGDQPAASVQQDAKQQESAKQAHVAQVDSAKSVADAVKRVADAAVDAVQKNPPKGASYDFDVNGSVGGKFVIRGKQGDFSTNGTVTFNGVQARTRGWSSQTIEGDVPQGVTTPADVVVHVDEKTTKRGVFRG